MPRKKTTIEEQWEKNQGFELTSVEQETYEKYFYGTEHWNYFANDEDLGPVILSIKQETLNSRDQFRILVRAISYTVHGLIPASCVFADRYLAIFCIFWKHLRIPCVVLDFKFSRYLDHVFVVFRVSKLLFLIVIRSTGFRFILKKGAKRSAISWNKAQCVITNTIKIANISYFVIVNRYSVG